MKAKNSGIQNKYEVGRYNHKEPLINISFGENRIELLNWEGDRKESGGQTNWKRENAIAQEYKRAILKFEKGI